MQLLFSVIKIMSFLFFKFHWFLTSAIFTKNLRILQRRREIIACTMRNRSTWRGTLGIHNASLYAQHAWMERSGRDVTIRRKRVLRHYITMPRWNLVDYVTWFIIGRVSLALTTSRKWISRCRAVILTMRLSFAARKACQMVIHFQRHK